MYYTKFNKFPIYLKNLMFSMFFLHVCDIEKKKKKKICCCYDYNETKMFFKKLCDQT